MGIKVLKELKSLKSTKILLQSFWLTLKHVYAQDKTTVPAENGSWDVKSVQISATHSTEKIRNCMCVRSKGP